MNTTTVERLHAAEASGDLDCLWREVIGAAKSSRPIPTAECILGVSKRTAVPRLEALCFDIISGLLRDSLDPVAREVVAHLTDRLADPDSVRMRKKISRCLGRIGRAAFPALPVLLPLRRGPLLSVVIAARNAIGWIGHLCLRDGTEAEQIGAIEIASRQGAWESLAWLEFIAREYSLHPGAERRLAELIGPCRARYERAMGPSRE